MHVPTNVKSPNNISERQMGFYSAFKGLICAFKNCVVCFHLLLLNALQSLGEKNLGKGYIEKEW
jgi:hypothetical protein